MSRKHRANATARPTRGLKGWQGALWIGLGVLVVVVVILMLRGGAKKLPAEISATEAFRQYQAGAFFLDVRSQAEWTQGHLAGSVLIPLDELPGRVNEVPRDRNVIVICRSGVRSKEGATILRKAGFDRVSCMTGGLNAWVGAGYPVEQ